MRRLAFIAALLLAGVSLAAQELPSCADPTQSRLIIPADSSRLLGFASRLAALRGSTDEDLSIWHIGGSHVQAGWFSSRIRHDFDSIGHYPSAGRGFIFPYPLAHTNYDRSYAASGEGLWEGTRSSNPNKNVPVPPQYGIMGIAAYTEDSLATFGIRTPDPFIRLHILGHASSNDVMPLVVVGCDTLQCYPDDMLNGYVADFPCHVDSVTVIPGLREGQHFMVTGLLPEDPWRHGLRFISTGVNGARTTTWMDRCPEFLREMAVVRPDLVILGLGINDSTMPAADFRPDRFKNNYRRLLNAIQDVSPDCAFVFISNNDSYRYVRRGMTHNDNGEAVRQAMLELASEYGGALWDLFGIMGGNGSATKWRDAGLMKDDRLHFTREGYELLGDMLYWAITGIGY